MEKDLNDIVTPLLGWYEINARKLPWRENKDPYRIFLSEIMLQQTRVYTVVPYFNRFIKEAPDVPALAFMPEQKLLKLWEGLGYYGRAKNLQKAAQMIVSEFNGEFPQEYEKILRLPGAGEYTAGAVASIALGQKTPAVDGNVLRVLSRVTADSRKMTDPKIKRQIVEKVRGIIPTGFAGEFNQSLMELGATICLPNGAPLCDRCPIAHLCKANLENKTAFYPYKQERKIKRCEKKTVFVIVVDGHLALSKRGKKGLLSGMWELPNMDGHLTQTEAEDLLYEWGINAKEIIKMKDAKHVFTHIEWHLSGYYIKAESMGLKFTFFGKDELIKNIALASAFKAYYQYALTKM